MNTSKRETGSGWHTEREERPYLNADSLNLFLAMLKKFPGLSASNPEDMDFLETELHGLGCNFNQIKGVIWRYRNVVGFVS